ncbi:MAG: nitrilase-related carbon-nitrogen hydrolase, partial [Candidatus Dormibacteria bacterium]
SPGNVIAAPGDARRETDGVGRVRDAVKAAVVARADLMVIPELSLSPRMLTALQDFLADSAGRGPIGTVAGLMHHVPTDDEAAGALQSRFVNEAVVLGPTGVELHRHRKLSAATFQNRSEDIRPGRSIFVLDTPAGGLAVVICLDLFAQKSKARIHQLPAQLLLVPSLSPGVSAHRSAASEAAHALWGLVLVCNRWFADDRGDAYSGSSRRSFAARAFTGCESLRLGASPISPSDGLFYYPHSE